MPGAWAVPVQEAVAIAVAVVKNSEIVRTSQSSQVTVAPSHLPLPGLSRQQLPQPLFLAVSACAMRTVWQMPGAETMHTYPGAKPTPRPALLLSASLEFLEAQLRPQLGQKLRLLPQQLSAPQQAP